MNKKQTIILVALAVISVVLFLATYTISSNTKYVHVIPAHVEVGSHVGLDVTSEYLEFGEVRPGGYSEKSFTISDANHIILTDEKEESWIHISSWEEEEGAHLIRLRATPTWSDFEGENTTVRVYAFESEPSWLEKTFFMKGYQIEFLEEKEKPNVFINITR